MTNNYHIPRTLWLFKDPSTRERARELYINLYYNSSNTMGKAIAITNSILNREGYNLDRLSPEEYDLLVKPKISSSTKESSKTEELPLAFQPSLFDKI